MFPNSARTFCIALVIASLATPPQLALAQAPSNPTSPTAGKTSITVTTQADEWDDDTKPASANTKCSLREALQAAYTGGNRGCGANKHTFTEYDIKFFASGTFKLTREEDLPHLGGDKIFNMDSWGVEIDGGSKASTARHYGIFQIVGATLNLKNLVLKNGSRPGGGAIWIRGGGSVVTAYKVKFKDNDAAADETLAQTGGAILGETGTLTVTESVFENNVALAEGGAVAAPASAIFIAPSSSATRGGGWGHARPRANHVSSASHRERVQTKPGPPHPV
ncbi:MAG: CSLREA domain-containing protein [Anaerolineae bacterium]|nr:CSLREA domain-containing protein [Anaerolineae bacterium]